MPLTILGVGLMIVFRQPGVNFGYIVMCQIFIALAGVALVTCEQMAAMAATSHQYVAVVLAVEGMFSSIGGAIESTVAAGICRALYVGEVTDVLGHFQSLPNESAARRLSYVVHIKLDIEVHGPTMTYRFC